MTEFLTCLVVGVFVGGVYALIGLGIITIYKATTVFNFAAGAMVALGGLLATTMLSFEGIPAWLCLLVAVLAMGAVALLFQRGILDFFVGKSVLSAMIGTLAFIYIFEGISTLGWGGAPRALWRMSEVLPTGAIIIGDSAIHLELMWSFVASLCLIGVLIWVFRGTKLGMGLRATAENVEVAQSKGISVRFMHRTAWIIAGIAAAVGGIFLGCRCGVNPVLPLIGLKAFPAVFLGGLNSFEGVVVGGIIIGVVESMAGAYLGSAWMEVFPFVVLLLVLALRPQGLFGGKVVERV